MSRNSQARRKARSKTKAKEQARRETQQQQRDAKEFTEFLSDIGGAQASGHFEFDSDPLIAPPPRDDVAEIIESVRLSVLRWQRLSDEGRPHEAAAAGDNALFELARPGVRHAVGSMISSAIDVELERLWNDGWEPADIVRLVRRLESTAAHTLSIDAVTRSVSSHAATSVSPRWHDQLAELGGRQWWPASSDPLTERLNATGSDQLTLLAGADNLLNRLASMPSLPPIESPPGEWREGPDPRRAAPPERMLKRVQSMLDKAESTMYEAEAESFTAAAQKLMTRYSIDQAMLAEEPDALRMKPCARRVGIDRPYEAQKATLLTVVADANRCRTVWSKELGFVTITGFESDISAAELLYTSVLLQGTRTMTAQGSRPRQGGGSRTRSFRSAFLYAFAQRIGERLAEADHEEVADASGHDFGSGGDGARGAGRGVVAVLDDRRTIVDGFTDEMFPELREISTSGAHDLEGWRAGSVAAEQTSLFGSHGNLERG